MEHSTLVLDTNVFIDITTFNELIDAFDKGDLVQIDWRRRRARDALLLSTWLDRERVRSLVLHEFTAMTLERVPPNEESLEGYFFRLYLYLLTDVFAKWDRQVVDGTEGLRGAVADDKYLEIARDEGWPLITNEDLTPRGIREKPKRGSLRERAKQAGVAVYTPEEFLISRSADPEALAQDFLHRLHAAAPAYVEAHLRELPDSAMLHFMRRVLNSYEWLFYPECFEFIS